MNSTLIRFISGLIAGFSLLFIYLKFGNNGIVAMVFLSSYLVSREYTRLLMRDLPIAMHLFFRFLCPVMTAACCFFPQYAVAIIVPSISLYLLSCIWVMNSSELDNPSSLNTFASSTLGFFYCFGLPTTAALILLLPQGGAWFLTLLLIVFSGDTFAYFFGRAFGKKPLAPNLSPKKTVEGSLGGLLGSLISAIVMSQMAFPHFPVVYFVVLAIVGSFASQTGDLFESLIKRVANVKDSGRIMPGHGGAMDRLDGVLFASPFVYALGLWLAM